ncbi:MAG: glycerol-3-phosphate dehydrogenase/oxidase [Rhodothermales bacterium]|nr:glycerol-3-phosphate dehydrogenase/oxidase [Rhodothermales bacterium]
MNRDTLIERLHETTPWDVLIIGGGATGLGAAIEAAARGYRTLLLEQHDFAKGTSSRSTKLVHGGVRYLKQGNIALVLEALRERGRLLQNAPHLVRDLPFVVPSYDWWEGPFYGIGLKVYDLLAGRAGFGASQQLSREETLQRLPTLEPEGLRGGTLYYDGQFDDARLAINMAQTALDLGATVLNYVRVDAITHASDVIDGVVAHDVEGGGEYTLKARVVINATGIFTDAVRRMDDPEALPMVRLSQGVHLVLDAAFLPGDTAIMVPRTDDGRVLFAIPWHGRALIGTTDTPVEAATLEPRPLAEELDFLLTHAARYLTHDPAPDDVLSTFAGLRPLVSPSPGTDTAQISRDHTLHIAPSGLVTITGGKWTTYRKMAEDTIDQASIVGGLDERASVTRDLHLHGWAENEEGAAPDPLAIYGADAPAVRATLAEEPGWGAPLHDRLPYRRGEVIWAARSEMARTVEDVLARRTRALLLDARAAAEAAPDVAALLAGVLGRGAAWQESQTRAFRRLADGYLL